jgi:acyl-CoA reductase-like NAD-dependent aldehyde dehydrogenase
MLATGTVPDQSADHVAQVVSGLRAAQVAWEHSGVEARVRWLRAYRDWLLDNTDRLNRILQSETGKPWAEAGFELPSVINVMNYYADRAPALLANRRPRAHSLLTAGKRQLLVHRPYAVVGNITPWNFPLALSLMDVVPALLAGCAAVVKPSEVTPLAVRAAVAGWAEIGAPPVLACVTGRGPTGAAVVDTVDYVQFTGSTRTGRLIAHAAAERLVPCSLELGGKDAMIVLADADLERAANAAVWGGFANAGQMCTSVERVYVEAPAYDEFVGLVADRTRALRVGADADAHACDVGPLVTSSQVEIVERHVEQALSSGAKALVGGSRSAGSYFEPTVLVDVDHSMDCIREETFGPTLPIMKVADADEAVRLANESPYGLSGSVFSKDISRGEAVARRIDSGAICVNDALMNYSALELPMGGAKASGLGTRHGAHGIQKYCQQQAILVSRLHPKRDVHTFPYSAKTTQRLLKLFRFLWGRGKRD